MFIVQGKPRAPEGIIKVIKETRPAALEAARDLLDHGMVIVTIIGDGRSTRLKSSSSPWNLRVPDASIQCFRTPNPAREQKPPKAGGPVPPQMRWGRSFV